MLNETEVLLMEEGVSLKLGADTVVVKGLCVRDSVRWSQKVKAAFITHAQQSAKLMLEVNQLSLTERVERAAQQLMSDSNNDETELLLSLVMEHTPSLLTEDVVSKATVRQLSAAFLQLFRLENPFAEVQRSLSM